MGGTGSGSKGLSQYVTGAGVLPPLGREIKRVGETVLQRETFVKAEA